MGKFIDLTGRVFGRWTVLKWARHVDSVAFWDCVCACGLYRSVRAKDLKNGKSTSCGCLRKDNTSTQSGLATSDAYHCWYSMLARCNDKTHVAYSRYGGAGIQVCDAWTFDFPSFLLHIGLRPTPEHSIDRIDNTKGYEPGNVRWATRIEQAANRKRTAMVDYHGVNQPLSLLARAHGLDPRLVNHRVFQYGWSVEKALTTPVT